MRFNKNSLPKYKTNLFLNLKFYLIFYCNQLKREKIQKLQTIKTIDLIQLI